MGSTTLDTVSNVLTVGISLIGYLYITVKSYQWLVSRLLSRWSKARAKTKRERAAEIFIEELGLKDMPADGSAKFATCGDITLMIWRVAR